MKKILSIIALLLISMMLFGCEGQSSTVGSSGDVFIGGTRGLEFSFVTPFGDDSTGNDIIYEGSDGFSEKFDIALSVKNQGETEIAANGLKVKLVGLNPDDFTGLKTEAKNAESIGAIERNSNVFEEDELSFSISDQSKIVYNEDIIDNGKFEATVTAYACYDYKTKVSSNICMRKSNSQHGTCENIGNKEFSVSAAPIQVTSVSQSPSSSKVNIAINIQNIGGGKVYLKDTGATEPTCSFIEDYRSNLNKVSAEVVGGSITCDNSEVRLVDGVGTLRCYKTLEENKDPYTEQITVELSYEYEQTAAHTFNVFDTNRIS